MAMEPSEATTPMLQQYLRFKEQYKGYILFFRLGDFYEMFFDDAKLVSKELELVLTSRGGAGPKEDRAPMCGIPHHSCDSYIARLIQKGYKIAVCEQMEDPALAKGLVRRDVIRIITPGTVLDSNMLDSARNNYLASVCRTPTGAGVCFCDISTGEIYATQLPREDCEQKLIAELGRFIPRELLLNEAALDFKQLASFVRDRLECSVELREEREFAADRCADVLLRRYGKSSLSDFEFGGEPAVVSAAGALLSYVDETQKGSAVPICEISFYRTASFMELDLATRRNLELCENQRTRQKAGSLLGVLDKTKTAMGARMLRKWLEQPLLNCVQIQARQNAVEQLFAAPVERGALREALSSIGDMERIMAKIVSGSAGGRDLRALWSALGRIPSLKASISRFDCQLLRQTDGALGDFSALCALIDSAVEEDPPITIREGGVIRTGYSKDVDELRGLMHNSRQMLAEIEARERQQTGIKNLKIGYNKVFGYYIDVTKSYQDLVPPHYIRKQTLANCERYITEELKTLENKILSASGRVSELEYELFCELRLRIAGELHRIQRAAAAVASLDALQSLAETATVNKYVRPEVNFKDVIEIEDGRHPVVEQMLTDCLFVPNDVVLDCTERRMAVITGPNMAGKSTYMRQVAVIVILAQIGSFVPARRAVIGVCDKVFTRVGASDDLSTGQSTFMVEMNEVAHILKNATKKSLIIYDEIGRGTSTYDGMAIARAVLEHTLLKIGARTLFATHYHELTAMEGELAGIRNYNVAVKKRGDDITFLRKIIPGPADDSYGVEVAKLAGVPNAVTDRAKAILAELETENTETPAPKRAKREEPEAVQLSLMGAEQNELAEALLAVDVNTLTPLEAMNLLYRLQEQAKKL